MFRSFPYNDEVLNFRDLPTGHRKVRFAFTDINFRPLFNSRLAHNVGGKLTFENGEVFHGDSWMIRGVKIRLFKWSDYWSLVFEKKDIGECFQNSLRESPEAIEPFSILFFTDVLGLPGRPYNPSLDIFTLMDIKRAVEDCDLWRLPQLRALREVLVEKNAER